MTETPKQEFKAGDIFRGPDDIFRLVDFDECFETWGIERLVIKNPDMTLNREAVREQVRAGRIVAIDFGDPPWWRRWRDRVAGWLGRQAG